MVSRRPAIFGGTRHCVSRDMFLVVEEHIPHALTLLSVCIKYANTPVLFIAPACNTKRFAVIFLFLLLFFLLFAFFGETGKSYFHIFLQLLL